MSKSTTLKCRASSGVEGAKLKCPNPAPCICTTGSPSPEISYQSSTPLTRATPSTRSSESLAPEYRRMSDIRLKSRSGAVRLARTTPSAERSTDAPPRDRPLPAALARIAATPVLPADTDPPSYPAHRRSARRPVLQRRDHHHLEPRRDARRRLRPLPARGRI